MRQRDVSTRAFEVYTSSKKTCSFCGHKQTLGRAEKVICTYCKHYIYKNSKVKFMNELRTALNRVNR